MRTIRILLVEDNPGDADLTCESLLESVLRPDISVAVDGEDAIRYLLREGKYADVGQPDLIILDLNLPNQL